MENYINIVSIPLKLFQSQGNFNSMTDMFLFVVGLSIFQKIVQQI